MWGIWGRVLPSISSCPSGLSWRECKGDGIWREGQGSSSQCFKHVPKSSQAILHPFLFLLQSLLLSTPLIFLLLSPDSRSTATHFSPSFSPLSFPLSHPGTLISLLRPFPKGHPSHCAEGGPRGHRIQSFPLQMKKVSLTTTAHMFQVLTVPGSFHNHFI